MALFYIPLASGQFDTGTNLVTQIGQFNKSLNHQLSFSVSADNPPVTSGSLTVQVKAPGSSVFEDVPNGVIDLSDIKTVLFQFKASAYRFTVSGTTESGTIAITDSSFKG